MNSLNSGWANSINNMGAINQRGSGMSANLSANRNNVGAGNFNNAQFGSWGNVNALGSGRNFNLNANNLGDLHNNLNNLNNSLGNNLNNLNRNLNQLNDISTNWNLSMGQHANQRSGFGNRNNAWFANTQWSSTGNANNQNLQGVSAAGNMRNSGMPSLGNQTGVGVLANASGTRIVIGNGTTGNLLEHANWPSSVYMLDVNATR